MVVSWDIEVTDEFEHRWDMLDEGEREDVRRVVGLLEEKGSTLPFPLSSGVVSSKHAHAGIASSARGQALESPIWV